MADVPCRLLELSDRGVDLPNTDELLAELQAQVHVRRLRIDAATEIADLVSVEFLFELREPGLRLGVIRILFQLRSAHASIARFSRLIWTIGVGRLQDPVRRDCASKAPGEDLLSLVELVLGFHVLGVTQVIPDPLRILGDQFLPSFLEGKAAVLLQLVELGVRLFGACRVPKPVASWAASCSPEPLDRSALAESDVSSYAGRSRRWVRTVSLSPTSRSTFANLR